MKNKKDNNKHAESKGFSISIKTIISMIIIICIILLCIYLLPKDKLDGTWTTDGNTIYEFDGKGNGALSIPSGKYDFTYTIEKNKIHLDFSSDKANDANYRFSIKKGKLTIKGIDDTEGIYVLIKVNK